jgi:CDP-paratose 2-epimerase
VDIRDRESLAQVFKKYGSEIAVVIHTAGQPSHDWAAKEPFTDFDVNAVGTLNVLESTRLFAVEAPFIHCSTNKVYGDRPNSLPLVEQETRYEIEAGHPYEQGITEDMSIDHSMHSIFGVSKVAADVMVQEYGRYFGMRTHCLRGGCLTGPNHSAVELHGFLSYLVKVQLEGRTYRIYGHKAKQVRDNIHSHDVAQLIERILSAPRTGEVYNLGGGRDNSCSILEAFAAVEQLSGKRMRSEYVDRAREGDHICYISDLSKIRAHFPGWTLTRSLDDILRELVTSWRERLTM